MAVASLVLSLLWIWGVGSLLAVIFGAVGQRQIDESGGTQTGRGMATAGLILGILGIVGTIVLIAAIATTDDTQYTY